MPDRPQVTVGAGRRPPVPGRRRRAAEAEQRPRALGGEAERPRTLDLRLPRAGGLEQDLTQQLVGWLEDRKSTRLNSSHGYISYAVFCLKKKKNSLKSHIN